MACARPQVMEGLGGRCWALHQGAHGHRPHSGMEGREGEISKNRKGRRKKVDPHNLHLSSELPLRCPHGCSINPKTPESQSLSKGMKGLFLGPAP